MNKAVEIGSFKGFRFILTKEVNILQFADGTILVADDNSDNVWSMKEILRAFEMMFGLKVNFHKSKVYGIQISDWLMEASLSFLACDIDEPPFKFLGVKVGRNPRKIFVWRDLIIQIKNTLENWKGRNLSFAGRVVL